MNPLKDFNPQLTKNFHVDEFACKDGTAVPWNLLDNVQLLADNLQVLRDKLKKPIKITSGFRNKSYNKSLEGATASMHIEASAADFQVEGLTPKQIHSKIEQLIKAGEMKEGGLGLYSGWVHYDVRNYKARWNG